MLLAGVVMKLGAYGALRVAMPLFPSGLREWSQHHYGFESWPDVFGLLALIGIVYGAMVALVEPTTIANLWAIKDKLPDLKHVIGVGGAREAGVHLYETLLQNEKSLCHSQAWNQTEPKR